MAVKKATKNMKFEEALEALEAKVALLEEGELPLETSIDTFKEATELSNICLSKLNTAKAAVEKLVADQERDTYSLEEFADLGDED